MQFYAKPERSLVLITVRASAYTECRVRIVICEIIAFPCEKKIIQVPARSCLTTDFTLKRTVLKLIST